MKSCLTAAALLTLTTAAGACELSPAYFADTATPDLVACMNGDFVQGRTDDLSNVLHLAVTASADPVVIDAIHAAAGPNWDRMIAQQTTAGASALHLAAQSSDDPRLITRLLAYGADPDAVMDAARRWVGEDRGTTALHLAAERSGGAPFVTALLAGGADPTWKQRESGATAIYLAARSATDIDTLAALMAFGGGQGEINTAQVEGRTPLMVAVAQDRPMPVIRFLLDRGAAIDAETEAGNTALHFAAMYASDSQVVGTLMALTEAPCATDETGRSARDYLALTTSPLHGDRDLTRRFHEACVEQAE